MTYQPLRPSQSIRVEALHFAVRFYERGAILAPINEAEVSPAQVVYVAGLFEEFIVNGDTGGGAPAGQQRSLGAMLRDTPIPEPVTRREAEALTALLPHLRALTEDSQ